MDFSNSMVIAASGMRAQTDRMRIIAENIANANSTAPTPGGDPYRRKIATMTIDLRPRAGRHAGRSRESRWPTRANFKQPIRSGQSQRRQAGLCETAQRQPLVEIMDMREAQRSYEADLTVMDATKPMLSRTVDLLNK